MEKDQSFFARAASFFIQTRSCQKEMVVKSAESSLPPKWFTSVFKTEDTRDKPIVVFIASWAGTTQTPRSAPAT